MNMEVIEKINISFDSITGKCETIITSYSHQDIREISVSDIKNWLSEYGVVILRGFEVDEDSFSELINNVSQHVTIDPARKFVSKSAQLVDAGTGPIGLHCENGNAPRLPDTLWFYCHTAANKGSRTTYCDGQRVWIDLPEDVKNLFLEQRIMYQRTLPKAIWKKYVFHEVGGFKNEEDVAFKDLEILASGIEGQTFESLDSGDVFSIFKCNAVHPSKYSESLTFANSLLGPSHNYEPPLITFEDGTPINDETWKVLEDVTNEHTEEIPWVSGDVAIIDNTRYMHGRRKIEDANRKICAALSYL